MASARGSTFPRGYNHTAWRFSHDAPLSTRVAVPGDATPSAHDASGYVDEASAVLGRVHGLAVTVHAALGVSESALRGEKWTTTPIKPTIHLAAEGFASTISPRSEPAGQEEVTGLTARASGQASPPPLPLPSPPILAAPPVSGGDVAPRPSMHLAGIPDTSKSTITGFVVPEGVSEAGGPSASATDPRRTGVSIEGAHVRTRAQLRHTAVGSAVLAAVAHIDDALCSSAVLKDETYTPFVTLVISLTHACIRTTHRWLSYCILNPGVRAHAWEASHSPRFIAALQLIVSDALSIFDAVNRICADLHLLLVRSSTASTGLLLPSPHLQMYVLCALGTLRANVLTSLAVVLHYQSQHVAYSYSFKRVAAVAGAGVDEVSSSSCCWLPWRRSGSHFDFHEASVRALVYTPLSLMASMNDRSGMLADTVSREELTYAFASFDSFARLYDTCHNMLAAGCSFAPSAYVSEFMRSSFVPQVELMWHLSPTLSYVCIFHILGTFMARLLLRVPGMRVRLVCHSIAYDRNRVRPLVADAHVVDPLDPPGNRSMTAIGVLNCVADICFMCMWYVSRGNLLVLHAPLLSPSRKAGVSSAPSPVHAGSTRPGARSPLVSNYPGSPSLSFGAASNVAFPASVRQLFDAMLCGSALPASSRLVASDVAGVTPLLGPMSFEMLIPVAQLLSACLYLVRHTAMEVNSFNAGGRKGASTLPPPPPLLPPLAPATAAAVPVHILASNRVAPYPLPPHGHEQVSPRHVDTSASVTLLNSGRRRSTIAPDSTGVTIPTLQAMEAEVHQLKSILSLAYHRAINEPTYCPNPVHAADDELDSPDWSARNSPSVMAAIGEAAADARASAAGGGAHSAVDMMTGADNGADNGASGLAQRVFASFATTSASAHTSAPASPRVPNAGGVSVPRTPSAALNEGHSSHAVTEQELEWGAVGKLGALDEDMMKVAHAPVYPYFRYFIHASGFQASKLAARRPPPGEWSAALHRATSAIALVHLFLFSTLQH